MKYLGLFLALSFLSLASCSSLKLGGSNDTAGLSPTQGGFVKEADEPTSRGQIQKVTPDQMDVEGAFSLSPDGESVVYSARQAPYGTLSADNAPLFETTTSKPFDLWKVSIHGGAPVKITSGTSFDSWSPSFTSDGKYIVYESSGQIWKVRADGAGGKQKIPGSGTGQDAWPKVSALDKIVFCSIDSNGKSFIWTSNLDGGELTQLREGSTPSWSPDGKLITFMFDGDVWVVNADGTTLVQLTSTNGIFEGIPSYSPDGQKIVYVSNLGKDGKASDDFNIWMMTSDGSQKTQLTELPSWDSWPVWSKDKVFFLSARATGDQKYLRVWMLSEQQ